MIPVSQVNGNIIKQNIAKSFGLSKDIYSLLNHESLSAKEFRISCEKYVKETMNDNSLNFDEEI